MEINKVIKKAMVDKGVKSMSELSIKSGVSYEVIKRVLKGENTSIKTASNILDCLGLQLTVINK